MASDMAFEISAVLQSLTLGYIIGLFVKILISSLTLYLSVRLVGGKSSLKKSILLTVLMEMVNLIALPMFTTGLLSLFLYILIWIILVTLFFELPIWRAFLVALVQGIITVIFVFLGLIALIAALFGATFL